jgi:HAMP domain-containing protein
MTFLMRRGLAVLALAIVLFAAVLAARAWRQRPIPPPAPRTARVADTSSDAIVTQALAQIPVDSAEIKNGWRDDVRGIDLDSLPAPKRELLLRVANSERCTCGCGFTLAACRTYDLTCPVSGPRVQSLRDSVARGKIRSAKGLRTRPPMPHP